jgi:hypothetical protein
MHLQTMLQCSWLTHYEGFKDRENRIQKQLLEFEKKIEQKLNFLENNACVNTDALNRTVTTSCVTILLVSTIATRGASCLSSSGAT